MEAVVEMSPSHPKRGHQLWARTRRQKHNAHTHTHRHFDDMFRKLAGVHLEFDVLGDSDSVGASDVHCEGFYHLGLPRQSRLVCSAWKPRTPGGSCWEGEWANQSWWLCYTSKAWFSYLLWTKQMAISTYHSTSYFHIIVSSIPWGVSLITFKAQHFGNFSPKTLGSCPRANVTNVAFACGENGAGQCGRSMHQQQQAGDSVSRALS